MNIKKQTKSPTVNKILDALRAEEIKTWFDLGLFLDKLKDRPSKAGFNGSYENFKKEIATGGLGILTFYYSVDGVTMEIEKYAECFRKIFPGTPIYLIGGEFKQEAHNILDGSLKKLILPEIKSFDNWELYADFFKNKLERGSENYNELIHKFWEEVLLLVETIGNQLEENKIRVLYLVNVSSNPGNVSLAMASVLLSEYMGIPVINNGHDYYWEGGNRKEDRITFNLLEGPRDFFFNNAHVGEVFSVIDVLYPWDSRSWISLNINRIQEKHIIETNGHSPANVALLGTGIDLELYEPISKRESIQTISQVADIFDQGVHSLRVVLKEIGKYQEAPFLTGNKEIEDFDFVHDNIIFLQPTRVISRKNIELNFKMIAKLFKNVDFINKFDMAGKMNLTILISGPIAVGQQQYFQELLIRFENLLKSLPEQYQDRVFLGFLFSQFDKEEFKSKYEDPMTIAKLFKAASLILLPSQQEGRGLPILEAAASGKPIFCRRYEPEKVYAEVIGEHLDEEYRLKVLEFKGDQISDDLVQEIVDKIFYPQYSINDVKSNIKTLNHRYTLTALQQNFEDIFYRLFLQVNSIQNKKNPAVSYFDDYAKCFDYGDPNFAKIINTQTRQYMAGYGKLEFMILLKSLIDPSFFRVEEQLMRGLVMSYAMKLHNNNPAKEKVPIEIFHKFFNTVESIFKYCDGEDVIRHDHSFSYRHRNKKHYPYRDYTFQELTGLINLIFRDIVAEVERKRSDYSSHIFFADWNLALVQLTNSHYLALDDREMLFKKLKQNIQRIYIPGRYVKYEMEFFILQPIRAMLGLHINDELNEKLLDKLTHELPIVYVFIHKNHILKRFSYNYIDHYLHITSDKELNMLYEKGVVKIVETEQHCIGFHPAQMGKEALRILSKVKEGNGFIITNGQNAAMMTDTLNIDHFHIGKVEGILASKIMGIPRGSGFVQFVPAGVRTTLAYPTPVQTAKDFDEAIKGKQFKKLSEIIGEEEIFRLMREDAETNGTPIDLFLANLESSLSQSDEAKLVRQTFVGGVYDDGNPWSGVKAEIETKHKDTKWSFAVHTSADKPQPVPDIVKDFNKQHNKDVKVAWNGGYILNPELVGKLGLPEKYIGSPLGMLVAEGKMFCPPFFNKPAFLIYKDGRVDIRRVNSKNGIRISRGKQQIEFDRKHYNQHSDNAPCYYDLCHSEEYLEGNGHIIVRLAGNTVKEILQTEKGEKIKIIPVGLTLSIPPSAFIEGLFEEGNPVTIELSDAKAQNLDNLLHAVEAGPMLVNDHKVCLDMVEEGWKTSHSINTQAARLDFTDMRGPKIAVGITKESKIIVLMVNGRLRESVGATHFDMANILIENGAEKAMGFDPGGSSTLVIDGKPVNISPYNKNFEYDIYSMPPEPRFVANAILAWT